jgi:hypothetical protein
MRRRLSPEHPAQGLHLHGIISLSEGKDEGGPEAGHAYEAESRH